MKNKLIFYFLLLNSPNILSGQNNQVRYSISGIIIKSYSNCSIHRSSVYQVADGYVGISKGNISINIRDDKYSMLMLLTGNNEYLNGIVIEQSKDRIVSEGVITANPTNQFDKAAMKSFLGYNDKNGNENAFSSKGCLADQSFIITINLGAKTATVKFRKNNTLIEEVFFKLTGEMY
jgi:hypothetical protein